MKKAFLLFLIIYISSFSIKDFNGINWGDTGNDLSIIFPKIEKEPTLDENTTILSVEDPKENIEKYQFYLVNDSLTKIRVVFDKEKIGTRQLQNLYQRLLKDIGSPVLKFPISKDVDNFHLKGNTIKFIPDSETIIYFTGLDSIDELGKMFDSNLYLDYIPAQSNYDF